MQILGARKKEISDGYMAYLLTQETCAIEQNSSNRDGKKEDSTFRIIAYHNSGRSRASGRFRRT